MRLEDPVEPMAGCSCCWRAADYACSQVGARGGYRRGDSFRFPGTVLSEAALLVEPCPVGCGALAAGRPATRSTTAAAAAAAVDAAVDYAAAVRSTGKETLVPSTSQQGKLPRTGRLRKRAGNHLRWQGTHATTGISSRGCDVVRHLAGQSTQAGSLRPVLASGGSGI